MIVEQLSVELVNQPGELSKISDLLGDEGVNIHAISSAPMNAKSVVRFVVDNASKAREVLKSKGYQIENTPVIAVETPDHPGGLNAVLRPLKEAGINVEYLYPFIGRFHDNAVLILGAEPIEEAISVLKKHYIHILEKELYTI
jgi:hypothetical protein